MLKGPRAGLDILDKRKFSAGNQMTVPQLPTHGMVTILAILYWLPNYMFKKKVKWSRYRPGLAQRLGRGIALLFHDRGTRRGWVVSSTPRPHFTLGKTQYPFCRRLGGPQGRSGRVKNLIPTGIRFWTVQPVAQSLYRLSYPAHP